MFTGEMTESKQNLINIKEVDADALEQLVEYCYTAEVKVTEDNVQVILKILFSTFNVFLIISKIYTMNNLTFKELQLLFIV